MRLFAFFQPGGLALNEGGFVHNLPSPGSPIGPFPPPGRKGVFLFMFGALEQSRGAGAVPRWLPR